MLEIPICPRKMIGHEEERERKRPLEGFLFFLFFHHLVNQPAFHISIREEFESWAVAKTNSILVFFYSAVSSYRESVLR